MLVGFCGADDRTDPSAMVVLSETYPDVEWGILFHPEREGQPRVPTRGFVDRLCTEARRAQVRLRLAAHLCGRRVQEVLAGDVGFVRHLAACGFERVQVNATRENGIDLRRADVPRMRDAFVAAIGAVPGVEWILQYNDQTRVLYGPMLDARLPNVSVLFDASCGTGRPLEAFPACRGVKTGYAGGISADNVEDMLARADASGGAWIDMESGVRRAGAFSVEECARVCARRAAWQGRMDPGA